MVRLLLEGYVRLGLCKCPVLTAARFCLGSIIRAALLDKVYGETPQMRTPKLYAIGRPIDTAISRRKNDDKSRNWNLEEAE